MAPNRRLLLPKHSKVLGLLLISLLVWSNVVLAQPSTPNGPFHRVIVQVNADFVPERELSGPAAVTQQRNGIRSAQDTLINSLSQSRTTTNTARPFTTIPYLTMQVDDQGLAALQNNPLVVSISEERIYYASTASANNVVNASAAWDAGFDGTGQIVAIIDTGVDFTHSALAGKAIEEACFSNDDYPDDEIGATLCSNGSSYQDGPGAAAPTGLYCTLPWINCDHGTHVAGIAAGNTTGFKGVAPGANIIAINVFSYFHECACIAAWDGDILRGLEHVYLLSGTIPNISSANLSLGGGYYANICDSSGAAHYAIVNNLRAAGIAVVAASGNDGYRDGMSFPACLSNVVSVGATYDWDAVPSFSSFASFLDIFAPGVDVNSSVPGGGYDSWNGTSMATPYVAGAWVLIRGLFPDATVDDILGVLKTGGHTIAAPNGVGYPRLDVFGALTYLPHRPYDLTVNHRELLDAMQTEAVATTSAIHPILVVFEVTQMKIYAEVDGVQGVVPVTLTVGDDMSGFRYGLITNADGTVASAAYTEAITTGLPRLVSAAINRLLDARYPLGYDLDYAFVLSSGLSLWIETP